VTWRSACENGRVTVQSIRRVQAVVVGSNFNDPTNERLIFLSAAGLAVVGIVLLVGTILWWRRGRQEHPALAPLEVLGSRAWTKAPEGDRRRRLEKVRIGGTGAGPDEPVRSEPLDLEALVRSVPQAFDDLKEPGEVIEADEPVIEPVVVGEPAADGAEPAVAGEPVEVVAEPTTDVPPSKDVATVEPVRPSPNGTVVPVVINDHDATSVTAERPSGEPAVAPGTNT
jgi:hypothetical protein